MRRMFIVLLISVLLLTSIPLGAASVSAASNAEQIFSFLRDEMGFTSAAACGVLANIEAESGFNPNAYGDNGNSYGICQWNGVRFTALRNWCGLNGYDYTTLLGQLNYLAKELSANDSSYLWNGKTIYNMLSSAENTAYGAYDAAYNWCYHYEVPANKEIRSIERANIAVYRYWPVYGDGFSTETVQLTAMGVNYPINLQVGQPFEVFGTIASPNYLEWVHCFVTDMEGNWIFSGSYGDTAAEKEQKIKIYDINLTDAQMTFTNLTAGEYRYYVQALDDRGYFVNIQKPFTVTADGTTFKVASQNCVHEHTVNSNYTWGAWVTEKGATCTSVGIKTRTCYCGAVESEEINTTAHTSDKGAVAKTATCTAAGIKTYKCTICGEVLKTETIAKKSHTYNAATCTKAKTCMACGATSGEKLGHDYEKKTVKATLSAEGTIKNVCKTCGYTASKVTTIYRASSISLSKTSYTYNGKVQTPSVIVKDSKGNTLKKNTDYTVTYASGRKNAGTYKVIVKMKGNYTGTKTLSFKINPISISKYKVRLSAISYTYNGNVKKPSVVVKNHNSNKLSSSSYTITYASGRKNVGTYKVTVKMKGNYSGTKTLTFKINPAKTTVKSLTAGKKSLKVAITKKTAQVSGYEVQYSTSKSFKSYKSKWLTSASKTGLTLSGLKAKTTYYVRVRTYKTVNGKKVYSAWSTTKYKKTK